MNLITPFTFDQNKVTELNQNDYKGPFDQFISDKPEYIKTDVSYETIKPAKVKKMSDGSTIVTSDGKNDSKERDLSMIESNKDYLDTYEGTNMLLKQAIGQIDGLTLDLKNELDTLRSNKMMKNKYMHLPNLASTLSSLISTKVTAIRELNNSITQSHNLDLKRVKELKLNAGTQDDSKAIFDLYNNFISAPGARTSMVAPTMGQMTSGLGQMITSTIGDIDYSGYQSSIPQSALNAMMLEGNPDIKTCVMYEQATGRRWFEVRNTRTNQRVEGVDPPDMMFMEDTLLDLNTLTARNTNLDTNYPIILVGEKLDSY